MPLHTIIDKEAFSDDIEFLEETTLEQIEL